jgi:hypothetical protein
MMALKFSGNKFVDFNAQMQGEPFSVLSSYEGIFLGEKKLLR